MQPFFVYMLRCSDGSYYVGHTDDLETRIAEHGDGSSGGYTSRRRPVELVWSAELDSRDEALQRELQVKTWSRAKKEALIASDWQRLKDLARGPNRSARPSTPREPDGSRYARDERDSGHERNARMTETPRA